MIEVTQWILPKPKPESLLAACLKSTTVPATRLWAARNANTPDKGPSAQRTTCPNQANSFIIIPASPITPELVANSTPKEDMGAIPLPLHVSAAQKQITTQLERGAV